MRLPFAYNVLTLRNLNQTSANKANPREINLKATPAKCDSTRCSAWFGGLALGGLQPGEVADSQSE